MSCRKQHVFKLFCFGLNFFSKVGLPTKLVSEHFIVFILIKHTVLAWTAISLPYTDAVSSILVPHACINQLYCTLFCTVKHTVPMAMAEALQ